MNTYVSGHCVYTYGMNTRILKTLDYACAIELRVEIMSPRVLTVGVSMVSGDNRLQQDRPHPHRIRLSVVTDSLSSYHGHD